MCKLSEFYVNILFHVAFPEFFSITLNLFQLQQFPCESSQISDYMAELKCYGTLCSEVYMHDKATVEDAVKVVLYTVLLFWLFSIFYFLDSPFLVGCQGRHSSFVVLEINYAL